MLLLLNDDIRVIEAGWLTEMVSHAIRPEVGIVGAKLYYPTGEIQHGGLVLGPGGHAWPTYRSAAKADQGSFGQLVLTRNYCAVTAACLAIRRDVFMEISGFDEINLVVAFNDVNLCLEAIAHGYRVIRTPNAKLLHLESVSRGLDTTAENMERFESEVSHLRKMWATCCKQAILSTIQTCFSISGL